MRATSTYIAAALLSSMLWGCGGDSNGSSGGGAPASHTVSRNGVMHAPGLQDPLTNCVACHGSSLQGGAGPSCTSCHGVKW